MLVLLNKNSNVYMKLVSVYLVILYHLSQFVSTANVTEQDFSTGEKVKVI